MMKHSDYIHSKVQKTLTTYEEKFTNQLLCMVSLP